MTHDVANHLLRMGTAGGVLAILIFLVTLLLAFKAIGRIVVSPSSSFPETVIAWSLGGVLFAHFVTFIGLSYWDQMRLVLYLHLGIGASVVAICRSGGIPDRSDECEVKTGGRVSANAIV